jgi:hypothetical protein
LGIAGRRLVRLEIDQGETLVLVVLEQRLEFGVGRVRVDRVRVVLGEALPEQTRANDLAVQHFDLEVEEPPVEGPHVGEPLVPGRGIDAQDVADRAGDRCEHAGVPYVGRAVDRLHLDVDQLIAVLELIRDRRVELRLDEIDDILRRQDRCEPSRETRGEQNCTESMR